MVGDDPKRNRRHGRSSSDLGVRWLARGCCVDGDVGELLVVDREYRVVDFSFCACSSGGRDWWCNGTRHCRSIWRLVPKILEDKQRFALGGGGSNDGAVWLVLDDFRDGLRNRCIHGDLSGSAANQTTARSVTYINDGRDF